MQQHARCYSAPLCEYENMRSDQLLQLSHELLLRPSLSSSPCEYEIWSLCHVSWLGGRPRKKMLIVPKMQSLCRLCEFIKNLYGIKFVVYEEAVRWTIEWNFVWKEFFMETKYLPIISTVITLLLGWGWDHTNIQTMPRRISERPPHQSPPVTISLWR